MEFNANALKKATSKQILAGVVNDTPVDTGEAISNWQVSVGRSAKRRGPLAPGSMGSTAAANRAATIAEGNAIIDAVNLKNRVDLVNEAPYITRLNQGSSKQAPAGFIERVISRAQTAVRFGIFRLGL